MMVLRGRRSREMVHLVCISCGTSSSHRDNLFPSPLLPFISFSSSFSFFFLHFSPSSPFFFILSLIFFLFLISSFFLSYFFLLSPLLSSFFFSFRFFLFFFPLFSSLSVSFSSLSGLDKLLQEKRSKNSRTLFPSNYFLDALT